MSVQVKEATTADAQLVTGLSGLLRDAVAGGSSVGFLATLTELEAQIYWRSVFDQLGPAHCLWVAESEGQLVGTVQLVRCTKPNGRHRAEVQKLLVRGSHRGRGIASLLMGTLESRAADLGHTLLVLDTEVGSTAEAIYRHLGWVRVGEIPNYALNTEGTPHATAVFYKIV